MKKSPIKKYVNPTNLVSEPRGTIWEVETEGEQGSLYVQVSNDDKQPHWLRMGTLLEIVFKQFCDDEMFMEEIFKLYQQESFSHNKIIEIIKDKKID